MKITRKHEHLSITLRSLLNLSGQFLFELNPETDFSLSPSFKMKDVGDQHRSKEDWPKEDWNDSLETFMRRRETLFERLHPLLLDHTLDHTELQLLEALQATDQEVMKELKKLQSETIIKIQSTSQLRRTLSGYRAPVTLRKSDE